MVARCSYFLSWYQVPTVVLSVTRIPATCGTIRRSRRVTGETNLTAKKKKKNQDMRLKGDLGVTKIGSLYHKLQ